VGPTVSDPPLLPLLERRRAQHRLASSNLGAMAGQGGHAFSGAPTWTLATELGLSSSSGQHTSRQRSSSVRLLTSTSSLDTWLGWRVRLGGLPHHGWHPIGRGCAKWSWSSIAEGGCSGRHDVHASSPVVEKAQLRHRRRGRAGHGDPLDLSWITT
jgi:hypothetical protein